MSNVWYNKYRIEVNDLALQVIENGVTYNVKKQEATLLKLTDKSKTDLVIPATISGKPVTKIATRAFAKSNIRNLNLPNSIRDIGASAFECCEKLEYILQYGTLTNSVIGISQKAFKNCSNLKELNLKYSLLILGSEVFTGCTQLHVLPAIISVSILTKNMFKDCLSLDLLEFEGPHIAKIEDGAFNNCPCLSEMVFKCKVELSNYIRQLLKKIDITTNDEQNLLDLAYEGYSIRVYKS